MVRIIFAAVAFVALAFPAPAAGEEKETQTRKEGMRAVWAERVHINGTIEGDYTWSEHEDVSDREAGSTSDLFVNTMELGIGVSFTNWLSGDMVLLAEDLGTDDETDVIVDEAIITLGNDAFPVYLVAGKRAQPFGVFENHLLTDPMTQDAYETSRAGLTVGFSGPAWLDVSATLYEGEEMMAHLFESGLFDNGVIRRKEDPAGDDVSSYIVSASVFPLPDVLTVFAGFLSEPGTDERNDTVNAGLNLVISGLSIGGEYMKALKRERYSGFARAFEEGVFSVGVAYHFDMGQREVIGGALFSEKKAHIVSELLEFAVRYERFDDDDMSEETQTSTVESRYSAGVRYAFYHDEESGLTAFLGAEYRYTDYRVPPGFSDTAADSNSAVITRLGVAF